MKRFWLILIAVVMTGFLTGCVTVRKVVRERVDQDISGNQGYLVGSTDASLESRPVDREYIDIRIEVPTWGEVTAPAVRHEDDKSKADAKTTGDMPSGNKGYVSGRSKVDPYALKKQPKTTTAYEYDDYEIDIYDDYGDALVYEEVVVKPVYQEYTVKEVDTLSHIAKAFYDKASKWTVINEANADKIKDPSRVKAGTKLRIPDLAESESKYMK